MKRCPTCNKTFTDTNLSFCTEDGTPLLSIEMPEDETTVVRPNRGSDETDVPAEISGAGAGGVPPYQPPRSYVPPDYTGQSKRKTWPWVVGIFGLLILLFAGLGIGAMLLLPNLLRPHPTVRSTNSSIPRPDANPGSSSTGGNENTADNSAENTPAPTDEARVLQDLTDLEQEWTVANVNADKTKLNRILADDYVGMGPDGNTQGKAEYLRTASPDRATQKWDFEDLKLSLKGDRATLTGVIRLVMKDEHGADRDVAFRFTDKFVWRDGRWQATGSVVAPLNEGTAA